MTKEEKLAKLKILTSDVPTLDDKLSLYLDMAEQKILCRVYPFKDTTKTKEDGTLIYKMPTRYDNLHVELASRYVFRQGFEGQTSSNENGIARAYGSSNDEDLLMEVMQSVGVV